MDESILKTIEILACIFGVPLGFCIIYWVTLWISNTIDKKRLKNKTVIKEGFSVTAYYSGGDYIRYEVEYNGQTFGNLFDLREWKDPDETSLTILDYGKYVDAKLRLSSYDARRLRIKSDTVKITVESTVIDSETLENNALQY